jgi:hypothetical protein
MTGVSNRCRTRRALFNICFRLGDSNPPYRTTRRWYRWWRNGRPLRRPFTPEVRSPRPHLRRDGPRWWSSLHTLLYTRAGPIFEAGAMRIPNSEFQSYTFDLINWLHLFSLPEDRKVELIPYILTAPGNRLYVNGVVAMGIGLHLPPRRPASIGTFRTNTKTRLRATF